MPTTTLNQASRQALAEIEAGELKSFATLEELFADLHADDDETATPSPAREAFLQRKVDAGRASVAAGHGRSNEEVETEFAAKRDALRTTD